MGRINTTEEVLQYQAVYYKDNARVTVVSENKEDLFLSARMDLPEADENTLIYISVYDDQAGQYQTEGRYRLLSGDDVTKVRLDIAPMEKAQFDKVREHIKELGARYDVNNNVWYIMRSNENRDAVVAFLNLQAGKPDGHGPDNAKKTGDGRKPALQNGPDTEGRGSLLQKLHRKQELI